MCVGEIYSAAIAQLICYRYDGAVALPILSEEPMIAAMPPRSNSRAGR
jgi:hypothetical protein